MGYSAVLTADAIICAVTVAYGIYIGTKIDGAK